MSFLSGPECSTAANPLSQFSKQTGADTSLQRDRLTSRQNPQLNGFRSQQGVPEDAAFQDFAHAGPQMPAEALPHFEQMRREQEFVNRSGGGTPNWAGEFGAQAQFAGPEAQQYEQAQRPAGFSPADFANFRAQQAQAQPRTMSTSPMNMQQSMYQRPMYSSAGFGMGMQSPMMFGAQPSFMQQSQPQQFEGKGKGRVQELSDTDWERQFEELSTVDKQEEELDQEAEEAMERELNQMDR